MNAEPDAVRWPLSQDDLPAPPPRFVARATYQGDDARRALLRYKSNRITRRMIG